MTLRIVLAHDAGAAWLEILPELRTSFRDEVDVDAFILRATAIGLQVVAEGTDVVAAAHTERSACS